MKLKDRRHLVFVCTFIFLSTQVNAVHKDQHGKDKSLYNKHKNVPRSALVGIHPEDLKPHTAKPKDVQGSRKSDLREVNLQTMEESQVMNALSGKLSRLPTGEERIISDFLKDMERSHGELTPSVMKKMVRIERYQPIQGRYRPKRPAMNLQGSLRSLGSIHPTAAMNPSILPFKLGGSQTFSNTESELGEENPAYSSNPLPEYDYKELKYDLPTTVANDYHGNYYHGNDDDYGKAYDPDNENDYGAFTYGGDEEESKMAGIGSIVGKKGESLVNEIGRKVLLNILQKQKEENSGKLNGRELPELLGAASVNSVETKSPFVGETTDSLPSQKGSVVSSSVQNDEESKPSINNYLTDLLSSNQASQRITSNSARPNVAQLLAHLGLVDTKVVTQEPQTSVASALNPRVPDSQDTPTSVNRNVDIGGKVNDVIDAATVTTPITTTPTSRTTSVVMTTSAVGRKMAAKDSNNDVVILKISGQGKPVSFHADTSTDGSLVLKIPKKFSEKIIQLSGNQATDTENHGADAHPGDLSADVIKLLAGKLGKSSLFGDQPQISDWEISGKKNEGTRNAQTTTVDLHPTRNVLPTDQKLSLPSLSSLLQSPGTQSEPDTKHNPKTVVQAPPSVLPSTAGLTVQQDLGNVADTPQNLIQSVFPNLAGLPPSAQNIEQLMTLLTHMEQLPSTQVGSTAYSGTIPTNYAVRQDVEKHGPWSLKGVLKASELVEDSGVARNKGIAAGKSKSQVSDNEWSPCTVTCGQGIQARARPCKGQYCSGFRTDSRPCNTGPCPEQLAKSGLKLHNTFRVWHHSPTLKWSPSLAEKAQKLADDLALNNDSSMLSAEMKELPGENIAVIKQDYEAAAETAVRQWYGEVRGYSFAHPYLADATRHFTQVVWKATKAAGIGVAKSKSSDSTYVVALYDPPGNMEGEERKNVKLPDTSRT